MEVNIVIINSGFSGAKGSARVIEVVVRSGSISFRSHECQKSELKEISKY